MNKALSAFASWQTRIHCLLHIRLQCAYALHTCSCALIGWVCVSFLHPAWAKPTSEPALEPTSVPTTAPSATSHRIVSLAPHLAQLAHAAGAAHYLVGVSEYTHASYAAQLPTVGNAYAIDWQRIAQLKPTLVLVWGSGTPAATKAKLKALRLTTFESEPTRLADIVREAQQLAAKLSIAPKHANLQALEAQYTQLLGKVPVEQGLPAAVFHPIWPKPLMTINGKHVISDALRLCGVRNVFAGAKGLTPTVTLQQVIREQVQAVILAKSTHESALNPQWQPMLNHFPAAHQPRIITVDGDAFHQPGPSMIAETLKLCTALQAAATQAGTSRSR